MTTFDNCWLPELADTISTTAFARVRIDGSSPVIESLKRELLGGQALLADVTRDYVLVFTVTGDAALGTDGFRIRQDGSEIRFDGQNDVSLLYGLFRFYRVLQEGTGLEGLDITDAPKIGLRVLDHWDNVDVYPAPTGSIERGYGGTSIFYEDKKIVSDKTRLRAYARLLASVGINAIKINNGNVIGIERYLITDRYLPDVKRLADLFGAYGIKIFISVDFAAPITISGMESSDPASAEVRDFWDRTVAHVYEVIPELGGFHLKADSEGRPGPAAYGRSAAEGANMMARALKPYGGLVFWRTFVYNTQNDWHDRRSDRAKHAYEYFQPQDGQFDDNVILQAKNGPLDFQPREPVSPVLGGMPETNITVEFQIAQEYTGQQVHLCYLVPQWKQVLDFDTHAAGEGSHVSKILTGERQKQAHPAMVGVSNIGSDYNWCGHKLAQANLYGYARLAWDPDLTADQITREWVTTTFGRHPQVSAVVNEMLLTSWETYENYTAPLGVGWMCDVETHFRCDIDSHEYGPWGACHYADHEGIGVYRSRDWSGYVDQYAPHVADRYNNLETCPDEFLLFFHHVPYTHRLHSGKTVIQHIYDTHFDGVEQVERNIALWQSLRGLVDEVAFANVEERLNRQHREAVNWRDTVNAYCFRKSAIPDEHARPIY